MARLAAIEDMAGMSILCSDKTGTLTMNKMEIQEETPIYKVKYYMITVTPVILCHSMSLLAIAALLGPKTSSHVTSIPHSISSLQDGESQYTLLRYAAMAAKWKEPPRDALDTLTLTAVDMPSMEQVRPTGCDRLGVMGSDSSFV